MPASDTPARYTRTASVLHWLVAIMVIGQIGWGWWMLGIAKQPVGPRVDAFNLHKSVGITIFLLMLLRIMWRARHLPPPFPAMPSWQLRLAHATHFLLYTALLIQPLAGYLGSEVSGYPVRFFGVLLPAWAGKNIALKDALSVVHLVTSWTIVALVTLHVAGALKHSLIDRDGLLTRIGLGKW